MCSAGCGPRIKVFSISPGTGASTQRVQLTGSARKLHTRCIEQLTHSKSWQTSRQRDKILNLLPGHWEPPTGVANSLQDVPEQTNACLWQMTSTAQRTIQTTKSEDVLIDALRGIKTKQELMLLQERLTSNPANPPLFNWVCNLLIERRISRGLAARVLSQLHNEE